MLRQVKRARWIEMLLPSMLSLGMIVLALGCSTLSESSRGQQITNDLNKWLGSTKDDRIKIEGVPTACTALTTGEEVCHWDYGGVAEKVPMTPNPTTGVPTAASYPVSRYYRVIITYGPDGKARAWSYKDSEGDLVSESLRAQLRYER
jgi:hypothetical protein